MSRIRQILIPLSFLSLMFSGTGKLFCQVSDDSLPLSFTVSSKNAEIVPRILLDSVKAEWRTGEDNRLGILNRYGVVQDIDVDLLKEGLKTRIGNVTVRRYEIRCPDALSLGIHFNIFRLPEGAAVYVYNRERTDVRGGFTSLNNKVDKELAIADFNGNSLIIEYNEPDGVLFPGELVIGYVTKAYASVDAAATRLPVNCPEGKDWQDEKRSVCMITFVEKPYSYYCTGFLINNVREDGTPYFMTASHCINTSESAGTLVAYFNYENSTCTGNDASKKQSLSGSVMHATNPYSDFTLLELSEDPPENYKPYFAGWNAAKTGTPASGTCIHHPNGSYKCLGIDKDPLASYPNTITWDGSTKSSPNTHWQVRYDLGSDESGSSGSPIFDENKRVVGQLHGGSDTYSYFGKFSSSWDYGNIAASQLKAWLDPDNSGRLQLDGTDYNKPPVAAFSSDVPLACLNTTVYLKDLSKYSPTEWLWKVMPGTFKFVNGTSGNSQNPEIQFTAPGFYSIQMVAANKNGRDSVLSENLIEAFSNLDVSFSGFGKEVTLCGSELKNYRMVAGGAIGYAFEISGKEKVDYLTGANEITLSLKQEARQQGSFDMVVKVTGSHGNCSASDSVLFHVLMPVNDDVKQALPLKLGRNALFSNLCGTVEINEPYPRSYNCLEVNTWCPPVRSTVLDNSVWFTFKGPSSGMVTIGTSGFDTQIAVYDADSYQAILAGNCRLVAANDDNETSGEAALIENISVLPGKTYWLQVDGNNGKVGNLSINLISNTIETYPNPSSGKFNLTVSTRREGYVNIEVYSVSGQRIYNQQVLMNYDNNTMVLDLSGNRPGIYFLKASIGALHMSKKLILIR